MHTPRSPIAALGTILSVWAHPDDETYLAGGVMAAAVDAGQRVVCVSATAGERGTDDPIAWPPARLGQVRRWEASAAMAVLGVTEHRVLELPDGEVAAHEGTGRAAIDRLLAEVDPDTILTFGPDGTTFHPDHVAISRWVTASWRATGSRARLLHASRAADRLGGLRRVLEESGMYMTDHRPVGVADDQLALRLLLRGPELDRKLTALAAMRTQTSGLASELGPAAYAELVAEEAFVELSRVG